MAEHFSRLFTLKLEAKLNCLKKLEASSRKVDDAVR